MKYNLQLSEDIFSLQTVQTAIQTYSGLARIEMKFQPGAGCFPSLAAGMTPS